ncbi:MAG TPA: hypothetical protein VG365_18150 [Solirubrobacteraceae bacterium]|nr:hypothetical protein [Solirubrobacteraceae bacterium]
MTDQPTSPPPSDESPPEAPATLAPVPPPAFGTTGPPAPDESSPAGGGSLLPADRPELAVGAAFAGGLVLALILKRLAR